MWGLLNVKLILIVKKITAIRGGHGSVLTVRRESRRGCVMTFTAELMDGVQLKQLRKRTLSLVLLIIVVLGGSGLAEILKRCSEREHVTPTHVQGDLAK